MADSFVFYRSFMDALEYVPEEEYCSCLRALLGYALDGTNNADTMTSKMFMALVIPQIDANQNRRKNGEKGAEHGKKGGRPRKETPIAEEENPIGVTEETPNVNVNVNENEEKEKTSKRERRFVPPTVGEVDAYCLERQNGIDPEEFVDFYISKGWKIGKEPMKDWKAAIRTWERKRKSESNTSCSSSMSSTSRSSPKINKFQNFPGRQGAERDANEDAKAQLFAMYGVSGGL